jgi:Protein of unknown function, DUF481
MHPKILLFLLIFTKTNLFGQIINIEELRIRTRDSTAFYGQTSGTANFSENKKKVFQAAADVQIEWKKNRNLVLGIGRFRYLQTGGERFLNDGLAHLRFNKKLFKMSWLTSEFFGQIQFNRQLEIRRRELLGVGFRVKLIKNKTFRAYFGFSVMPENVYFTDETTLKTVRLNQYLSVFWQPTRVVIFQSTFYFQPEIGFINHRRWSSENLILLKISRRFQFKMDWSGSFDRNLPTNAARFSQIFSNGLTWIF